MAFLLQQPYGLTTGSRGPENVLETLVLPSVPLSYVLCVLPLCFLQTKVMPLDTGSSVSWLRTHQEFPGGPVVRTPLFHCKGVGLIPGWGTKIP